MKDKAHFFIENSGQLDVKRNVSMKDNTTFKIGGVADLAVYPKNKEELVLCVELSKKAELPFYVVGKGSNLLVDDKGYRGVIIFTGEMKDVSFDGNIISASAGVGLTSLARMAGKKGLSGMECLCGIPGTVGGAVYMNAGAYGGEIKDVVVSSDYYSVSEGFGTFSGEEQCFDYRKSAYTGSDKIILSAKFVLNKSTPEEILKKEEEYLQARRDKQPLEYPSAGSTFKRYPGRFTGKMIEEAGLKGFRIGGALVSEKHAGFLVSDGSATSEDMISLIREVRRRVYEKEGVTIECEVKYLSEEGEETL